PKPTSRALPDMTHRRKLIEVALPLEAINAASAREKSIGKDPGTTDRSAHRRRRRAPAGRR
ncbi:MAG: hypothetical protein ACREIR_21315, partial [Geminicoccaceae bacterium]